MFRKYVLQAKDTTLQNAIIAVAATQSLYKRQRSNEAFYSFYYRKLEKPSALEIGKPIVPRYRKPPKRFGGDKQHNFLQPREYYRHQYFEACDLLIHELNDRFEQKEII